MPKCGIRFDLASTKEKHSRARNFRMFHYIRIFREWKNKWRGKSQVFSSLKISLRNISTINYSENDNEANKGELLTHAGISHAFKRWMKGGKEKNVRLRESWRIQRAKRKLFPFISRSHPSAEITFTHTWPHSRNDISIPHSNKKMNYIANLSSHQHGGSSFGFYPNRRFSFHSVIRSYDNEARSLSSCTMRSRFFLCLRTNKSRNEGI